MHADSTPRQLVSSGTVYSVIPGAAVLLLSSSASYFSQVYKAIFSMPMSQLDGAARLPSGVMKQNKGRGDGASIFISVSSDASHAGGMRAK